MEVAADVTHDLADTAEDVVEDTAYATGDAAEEIVPPEIAEPSYELYEPYGW